MAVPAQRTIWDGVLESTKAAQERSGDPLLWAIQLSGSLSAAGVELPSTELAEMMVDSICWDNNVPIAWKFLEKALVMKIVPPILVLSLLSEKVVPSRSSQGAAYRLYMELLKRHAFSFASQINSPNFTKIMKSVDEALHLSQVFAIRLTEPGLLVAVFLFSIMWQLLDASLADERLLKLTPERKSRWPIGDQDMHIDSINGFDERSENKMQKSNTVMAVEIIGELFKHKGTSRVLHLARRNMSSSWRHFSQHLQVLVTSSSALRSSKNINPETLLHLTSEAGEVLSCDSRASLKKQFHAVVVSESPASSASLCHGSNLSAVWISFDLFFEDSMDGSQVEAFSSVDVLTGLVKSLQAVNRSTWQDAFLALWIAALRLIQRERDVNEGPVPRIDTCLCMLLCIATLAISNIIEEEESSMNNEANFGITSHIKEKHISGKRRRDLVSSLNQLGDYEGLLAPPTCVVSLANQAAAKAMMFLSGITTWNGYPDSVSLNDLHANCSGNLRHLIVEACIARGLLDTSAYASPGYVKGRTNQIPRSVSGQVTGWSALMKGSPLTPPLVKALVSTPASSLGEIEKIYEIAANGSDEEKIYSATILCGASLVRGWNIQEHVVLLITKLLYPPVPPDYSGSESHLLGYAPMLNVLLVGVSSIDCVQIFSMHGLVPQLAAALMPVCELFGSCLPSASWTVTTGEEITPNIVFSNAFTLLLKLWRFDRPPLENVLGDVAPVGSKLTPDFLLLVNNAKLASYANSPRDQNKKKRLSKFLIPSSTEPIFMDSFPKLKCWYFQHQECLASTLSSLVPGSPAHQIFDLLLTMMFKKTNRGGQPTNSGSSNSSGSMAEEASHKLKLPAWDILEAIPYVLDAALSACAHGKLSPRELVTGLKDLADFLPASLPTIVSYFTAEVSRGIWKPAYMNGSDWPSPAGNLAIVEQQIRKILAGTGVDVPSLAAGGSSPATLPLPLAALVSLTITYKLDKAAERYLFLVGPSLITLAACCPWPCLPIIAALWSQKVRRWNDFLTFSASRTVFHHNSDAVDQLLKSCFTAILGLNSNSNSSPLVSNGGVASLLGLGIRSAPGEISPVAPGILYLRVHRSVRSVMFMTEEIVVLLMRFVKDISTSISTSDQIDKLKKTKHGTRQGPSSSASALTKAKHAATLGASLVWLTGGLSSIITLIREILPSWFISDHKPEGHQSGGKVALLRGFALAYFAILCGSFAWGVDTEPLSVRRRGVLETHLEFVASALDGKISLGCDHATWRGYVTGLVSLIVECTPTWMLEVDVNVLKRVSKGLRLFNEDELAFALLRISGCGAMGAAVELIIESE